MNEIQNAANETHKMLMKLGELQAEVRMSGNCSTYIDDLFDSARSEMANLRNALEVQMDMI